jgi:hypothetical protein
LNGGSVASGGNVGSDGSASSGGDEEQRAAGPIGSGRPKLALLARLTLLTKWAFAIVPLIGLVELAAHTVQSCSRIDESDWRAARDYVATQATGDDLVAFAPRWVDPIGREFFGPSLATLEREARADETRFARAFEVSIRGAHIDALAGWRRSAEQRFGAVRVTTWENPARSPVIVDLVSRAEARQMQASLVQAGGEQPCSFVRTGPISGGLGFGPALPGEHAACPGGGFVGVSVAADLEYHPRRCIYAPPPGPGGLRRLRFPGVRMGQSLRGHHAIYVEAERAKTGAPVMIACHVGDSLIGEAVHRDGEGWKGFEFDTSSLAGTEVELVADIASSSSDRRLYCFEATTR